MIQLTVVIAIVAFIGAFYAIEYYKLKEEKEDKKPHNDVMLYMATQAAPEFHWILGKKKTMEEWRDAAMMMNSKMFSQLDGLTDEEFKDAFKQLLKINLQEVK